MEVIGAGAGSILLAGCSGGDGGGGDDGGGSDSNGGAGDNGGGSDSNGGAGGTDDMDSMKVLETDGGINALVHFWGREQGIYAEQNIDLSIEVAPFGRYERQVIADLTDIGAVSIPGFVSHVTAGEDVVALTSQANFYNKMYARKETDIEGLSDLSDAALGVPLETSTTTNATRTIGIEDQDFDILNDTGEVVATGPPNVFTLLNNGEIDAGLFFESDSVKGATKDDWRMIYDPGERWREISGSLPPLTFYHTYRDWVNENPGQAIRFLRAWEDAVQSFNENIEQAASQYGRLAGIESEAEREQFATWVTGGPWWPLESAYPSERADRDWEFVNAMSDAGVFDAPAREDVVITTPELEDMAGTSL